MVEFLKRAIAPRGLGAAFTLAFIPYLCRVDNAFMFMLDASGVERAFLTSFFIGVIAASIAILIVPLGSKVRRAQEAIGGSLLCVAGIVAVGLVQTLPSLACAIAGGLLIGIGLVAMMRQWFAIYAPLSLEATLTTSCLTLFLASTIWYLVRHTTNFYVTCLCLAVCVACGGLLCVLFLVLTIRQDRLDPVKAQAAVTSGPITRPRWIAFAGFGALWFNFFTLGLTLYTDSGVGVLSTNVTNKMLPYAVVGVVIIAITYVLSVRRKGNFTIFLATMLAIGAAIELASPFIDGLFEPGSTVYQVFSYAGVALFNVLGFALPLHQTRETDKRFSPNLAVLFIGCVAAMAAGATIYEAVEETGQLVSLCVMTVYLVALVIAAMNTSLSAARRMEEKLEAAVAPDATTTQAAPRIDANEPVAAPEPTPAVSPAAKTAPAEAADPRRLACDQLVERYQLSPRESEVLWLLARGYGARYIGERLFISADTVRTHCKRIYEKVGVHNKEELIELIEAFEQGSTTPAPQD